MDWLKELVERHRLVRRVVLVWVLLLKTWAIGVGLAHLTELNGNAVTFLLAVVAMLDGVVLYYFKQRQDDAG